MNSIQHTDVVVIGGGAAGIAASVAAARRGSKVMLIERNSFLGGKATAAEVGTICGLYNFSKSKSTTYIVKGFAKEFAESLQLASNSNPLYNAEGLHYLPYNIEVFKSISLELLKVNQVDILFNSTLEKVNCSDENINAVIIKTGPGTIEIKSRSVIDCSGDSIISQAANLPLLQSDHYQAAAQVFTIQNVAEENESRLGLILMKAIRSAIIDKRLEDHFDRVYIVQGSLINNTVSLKIGIPVAVTYDPGNLKELEVSAKTIISTLFHYLQANVPAFKNASIQHIAPEVGIRVGHRTIGDYILTEEDVLSCKKFEHAIANGSWPIEEWEQHKRVKMRYFNQEDFYQVPAECLRAKNLNNLFIAGRNISATNGAIASARVMGICLQTGYAAGWLASDHINGVDPADSIKNIQNDQL